MQAAYVAVEGGLTHRGLAALEVAEGRQTAALAILARFVNADFDGSLPAGTVLDEDEREIAIAAFLRERIETYVADDGSITFEAHEDDR